MTEKVKVSLNNDIFNRYCNCCLSHLPKETYYKIELMIGRNDINVFRLCGEHLDELQNAITEVRKYEFDQKLP